MAQPLLEMVLVGCDDPDEFRLGPGSVSVPLEAAQDAEMIVAFDPRRRFGRVVKARQAPGDWCVRLYGMEVAAEQIVRHNEELAEAAQRLVALLEGAWWLQAAEAYGRLRELTGLGPTDSSLGLARAIPPIDPGRWAGGGGR